MKRLHDMDMNGAHYFWIFTVSGMAGIMPVVGTLASLGIGAWLCCTPGTDGANRFGQPRLSPPGFGAPASYHRAAPASGARPRPAVRTPRRGLAQRGRPHPAGRSGGAATTRR